MEVAPAIKVTPDLIDLGTDTFDVHRTVIPIKKAGSIAAMDIVIRPLIKNCKINFVLETKLDRTDDEIKDAVILAGTDQGLGSGRKIGFGPIQTY